MSQSSDSDVAGTNPGAQPQAAKQSSSGRKLQVAAETTAEIRRLTTPRCTPYVEWQGFEQLSGERSYTQMSQFVDCISYDYINAVDLGRHYDVSLPRSPLPTHGCVADVLKSIMNCLGVPSGAYSIHDVFARHGRDALILPGKRAQVALHRTRSTWADFIIRQRTIYHNGSTPYEGPDVIGVRHLHELCQTGAGVIPPHRKTKLHNLALDWVPPSFDDALKIASKTSSSNHPEAAAYRHLIISSARKLIAAAGMDQYDVNVSAADRDAAACGPRPVHTVKDLPHLPHFEEEKRTRTKLCITLVDTANYMAAEDLRQYAGHDIFFFTSLYTSLADKTSELTYFATGVNEFTEVIGRTGAPTVLPHQRPWQFTNSDICVLESEARDSFTVYSVVKYAFPEIFKQVVFMCAMFTVNMPFAVANELVRCSKGHDLLSTGVGSPGPCQNMSLVPADPERPFTSNILVMSCGTPDRPMVLFKYETEESPDGVASMSTVVHRWLRSLNSSAGRPMMTREIQQRLEAYMADGEAFYVPGASAYCEVIRSVSWFGSAPAIVYNTVNGKFPTKEERKQLRKQDLLRSDLDAIDQEGVSSCCTYPSITGDSTNPCAGVRTELAYEASSQFKLKGMKNTVEPDANWSKFTNLTIKYYCHGVERETGIRAKTLRLVDQEEVLENRTRANQVQRREDWGRDGGVAADIGQAHLKSCTEHKTPDSMRVVQSPEQSVSERSGILCKTLEKALKLTKHYGPGNTPSQVAEAVREVYATSYEFERNTKSGRIRGTDYTAADDSHSKFSNMILRAVIEYFIHPDDVKEALAIYDSCFNMELRLGARKINTGWKNASGTGITTILNTVVFAVREMQTTMVAMFFTHLEWEGSARYGDYGYAEDGTRRPFPIGHLTNSQVITLTKKIQKSWGLATHVKVPIAEGHKAPVDGYHAMDFAYALIGFKYGDDGLDPATPFVKDGTWYQAMKYVDEYDGFKRKLEEYSSAVNEDAVEVLSRVYPAPMREDVPSSYCKIEKALDKLSISTNRNKSKFILKLRGYHTVDKNTPFVGALTISLGRILGVELTNIENEAELNQLQEVDRDLYHKVVLGSFPWGPTSADEQFEQAAKEYGITASEARELDKLLRNARTLEEIGDVQLPAKPERCTRDDKLGEKAKEDPAHTVRIFPTDGGDPWLYSPDPLGPPAPGSAHDPLRAAHFARDEAAKQALLSPPPPPPSRQDSECGFSES